MGRGVRRRGSLATQKPGDESGAGPFVGPINEYPLAEIMRIPLQDRLLADRASGNFFAFDDRCGIFKQLTQPEAGRYLATIYAGLSKLSSLLAPLAHRPCSVRMMRGVGDAMAATVGEIGALIKSLTGGDLVEDRGPHAQLLVSITGDKVFVLVSNSVAKVDLDDDAESWCRRMRPYRFHPYPVEKRMTDFAKVLLQDEGGAILNRLIDGARRRMQLRIDGKRPEMKPPMLAIMDEILRRSCAVASYIEPRLV